MKAHVMFGVRWWREEIRDPQRLLEAVASLPLLDMVETDGCVYVGRLVASVEAGGDMYVPDVSERERGMVEGLLEGVAFTLDISRLDRPTMLLVAGE